MRSFELETWLRTHCAAVEEGGGEMVFRHAKGRTSILLPREVWRDGLIRIDIEPLASFYEEFFGASIDNSQIIIATNIRGGIGVSHRYNIPDLEQMAETARGLGVKIPPTERVFMTEAAYMLFYTVSEGPDGAVLRQYDRDYKTNQIVNTLEEVLDNWWAMLMSGS